MDESICYLLKKLKKISNMTRAKSLPDKDALNQYINAFFEDPVKKVEFFNTWLKINLRFYQLVLLFEAVKTSFFNRTISLEMPQVELGYHRGLEVTTGNDGFILGGEIIIKNLIRRINSPFMWDGLFTFGSLKYDEIFGAAIQPLPDLKLFHITTSDEFKYFAGNYFTLAHEISHTLTVSVDISFLESGKGTKNSFWYSTCVDGLQDFKLKYPQDFFPSPCKNFPKDAKEGETNTCPIWRFILDPDSSNNLFNECLVDFFAINISGPGYPFALLDTLPIFKIQLYLRLLFLIFSLTTLEIDEVVKNKIIYELRQRIELFKKESQISSLCNRCLLQLTIAWFEYFIKFNKLFFKKLLLDLFAADIPDILSKTVKTLRVHYPNFMKKYERHQAKMNLLDLRNSCFLKLFNYNISDLGILTTNDIIAREFKQLTDILITKKYSAENYENVKNAFSSNRTYFDADPLVLLNVYYDCFRSGENINYYAFLKSLLHSL